METLAFKRVSRYIVFCETKMIFEKRLPSGNKKSTGSQTAVQSQEAGVWDLKGKKHNSKEDKKSKYLVNKYLLGHTQTMRERHFNRFS